MHPEARSIGEIHGENCELEQSRYQAQGGSDLKMFI